MIAIVYPLFYSVAGISRYLDSVLSNLPVDHPPIYLITGDEDRRNIFYPGVEIIHIPLTSNRFSLFLWSLQVRKYLIRLHAQGSIKWVNLHIPPLIPGLFLPKQIPLILTAHTTYLGMSGRFYEKRHFNSQWNGLSLMIKSWMEKRIFSQSSKVIVLTEQGRQEVLSYGFNGPVTVIPNGADVALFTPDETIDKDIDVLFCGRIEPRKGSRALPELCHSLVKQNPDIKICIVGYGEDDAWVGKSLASLSSNVQLTGKIPFSAMIGYYNRSKIYASTSYYEGLPGTCLEAMAMQLPVVVWDFLFYRSLVIEGETGYLIAPNDYVAMTSKLLALLQNKDDAVAMGKNGRALLESNYSWAKLSNNVLDVFA